jgi:serine/arginine repetitive matrix protein 2
MVKSSSVLSCLLPARFGLGSQKPDSPSRTRNQEKHAKATLAALGDPEFDPFRCSDPPRARANTAPSSSQPPPLLIPDGGIGESPSPVRSLAPPVRPKRSSFTTFFAFSSKGRPTHRQQDPSHSVPGRWVSDSGKTQVQLINSASIPSPLRTEEEEYYYSYYASLTPTFPSHSASSHPDAPSKHVSPRQQDLIGNPDLDSQLSSPVDSHPSHTLIRHPFSYSTPPRSDTIGTAPHLRHATSQPLHHHPRGVNAGSRIPTSHLGHGEPHLLQPELKTSMSTPNLAVRPRSLLRKKPTRSKGQDRWLSAETWWDALFSPSPRFKVKQAPRPDPATGTIVTGHVSRPVQREPNRHLGVTFPSVPAVRPRAVSATSDIKPTFPVLSRSRSAVDLSGQPPTPRAGFEPALETLVDEPTPPPERSDTEFPLPDPPLSLAQYVSCPCHLFLTQVGAM